MTLSSNSTLRKAQIQAGEKMMDLIDHVTFASDLSGERHVNVYLREDALYTTMSANPDGVIPYITGRMTRTYPERLIHVYMPQSPWKWVGGTSRV